VAVAAGVADVGVDDGVVGAGVVGGGAVVEGVAGADEVVGVTVGVADGVTRMAGVGVARRAGEGAARLRAGAVVAVRDRTGLLAGLLVNDDGSSDGDPSRSDGDMSWVFTTGGP
jgi:hypothetical protein